MADEVESAQNALGEMMERLARAQAKSAEDRVHLVDTALKSLMSLASRESTPLGRIDETAVASLSRSHALTLSRSHPLTLSPSLSPKPLSPAL